MKLFGQKYRLLLSGFNLKDTIITAGVLIAGLLITIASVVYNRRNIESAARRDFEYSCNQIRMKIETRLEEHAQLLRGGKGLFAVSDTVTVDEWQDYFNMTKIDQYLPGIQGFGYTMLIKPEDLNKHEERFRKIYAEYKPDYKVYPRGVRDVYTSIVFLEPHNERNRTAIGYDMFSERTRRKAMEISRDSNFAMLTGKVWLVQEIDDDRQPGVLMYDPDYRKDMPLETVEQRREALKGWLYSPYRMRDLMQGILGTMSHYEQEPIRLQIYDDTIISDETILYDSGPEAMRQNLDLKLTTRFRGKIWTLVFSGRKAEMSAFHSRQIFIWLAGFIITILLFILSTMQIRANIRTRQIEQLNKQLERSNADKDRFIAILSHDLKSPFTSILGFLEILTTGLRRFTLDQIETHLNTVNEAAKNTFELLQDLLMWTRAHTGKIPFNPENVTLRDKFDNVIPVLLPMADSKNVSIEYHAPENLSVYADKDMLKVVLRNLITNAIKFTKPGGSVSISAFREDGIVTISVSDTGIGIRPEQQPSIFDISKILPTTGTAGEKGSGLGLLLCKEFIEIHGGKIWFTSQWEKGSDFRFSLPEKNH
ncbi:MAG TPA: CHASE domain-containing protein [Bacteroidales bacterium]|nr:CHASE domain-containing protein [Bacteroidales bacterium]